MSSTVVFAKWLDQADGWWSGDTLRRWLTDFIQAEWRRLRPGLPAPAGCWPASLRLDEAGLGLDSLERLQVATALSKALHMHESGIADTLLGSRDVGGWAAIATASLQRFSRSLTVHSSGSTGVAKTATHSLADLAIETEFLALLVGSEVRRVLSTVPAHHIYGFLFTILLPQRLGTVPVLDIRDHSPGALAALAQPGDLVIAHPDWWAAAVRGGSRNWPVGVVGVTSTAPCPAETAQAVAAAGLSRLLQIHGASETAGIGWRDDPAAAYTLMPHWTRDGPDRLQRGAVSLAVPDRLEWLDERRYHVAGRLDGAVQVGGINVFPARVQEVLCQHPKVVAAAVRLMTEAEGCRLKAYVVLEHGNFTARTMRAELMTWAAARLSTPEQPRAYSFGPALPTDPLGKAADWPAEQL